MLAADALDVVLLAAAGFACRLVVGREEQEREDEEASGVVLR